MIKREVVLFTGVLNENGVIYTKESIENALKNFELKHKAEHKPMLGTFTDRMTGTTIPLSEVTHQVTDMEIEDNKLIATIQILDTPSGRTLQEFLTKEKEVGGRGSMYSFGVRGIAKEMTSDENGNKVVHGFDMTSVNVMPADSDSFKNYR